MSQEVTEYIANLGQAWQGPVCGSLHQMIHRAIPDVTERLQYGKPHYLKNGTYACVIGTAKGSVSLTIFNAGALDAPDGVFEPGPAERRTVKIKQGQAVDFGLLTTLIQQAAKGL